MVHLPLKGFNSIVVGSFYHNVTLPLLWHMAYCNYIGLQMRPGLCDFSFKKTNNDCTTQHTSDV